MSFWEFHQIPSINHSNYDYLHITITNFHRISRAVQDSFHLKKLPEESDLILHCSMVFSDISVNYIVKLPLIVARLNKMKISQYLIYLNVHKKSLDWLREHKRNTRSTLWNDIQWYVNLRLLRQKIGRKKGSKLEKLF